MTIRAVTDPSKPADLKRGYKRVRGRNKHDILQLPRSMTRCLMEYMALTNSNFPDRGSGASWSENRNLYNRSTANPRWCLQTWYFGAASALASARLQFPCSQRVGLRNSYYPRRRVNNTERNAALHDVPSEISEHRAC